MPVVSQTENLQHLLSAQLTGQVSPEHIALGTVDDPISSEKGRVTWRLTVAEQHLRTHCILHGGVVATMLDTAMGRAVSTL